MDECLGWVILLLLAQWFFGNLYEAVVLNPNLMRLIELNSASGEALFPSKVRSPVAYYVPGGALVMALTMVLALTALLRHTAGSLDMLVTLLLILAGAGLTIYVVRTINLELFFRPAEDLDRARRLLHQWTILNYVRLAIAGTSLMTTILWIRIELRS